jgi:hypothetical protein
MIIKKCSPRASDVKKINPSRKIFTKDRGNFMKMDLFYRVEFWERGG